MDYTALTAKWPTVSGADARAKLAALNAETAAGPRQDVSVGAVEGYMRLGGLITAMQTWVDTKPGASSAFTAANELLGIIGSVHVTTFEMSKAPIYAAVQGFLGALAASPPALITTQNVSDLLAMAETTVPWHIANGYPNPINANDLVAAGLS